MTDAARPAAPISRLSLGRDAAARRARAPVPENSAAEEVARQQQIQLIDTMPVIAAVNVVGPLAAAGLLWSEGPLPALLLAWAGALAAIGVVEGAGALRLSRGPTPRRVSGRLLRRARPLSAAIGLLWGLAVFVLHAPGVPELDLLAAVVVAGVVAGTASVLLALPGVSIPFMLACATPLVVKSFLSGTNVDFALVVFVVAYLGALSVASVRARRSLERFVEANLELARAKAAAESADVAKTEFLANMSHEIRTPLNGVLGLAEALAGTPLDERQADLVGVMREAGDTLLSTLNEILDLSKIEAGLLEIERAPFCFRPAVEAVCAVHRLKAEEKGVRFRVEIDEPAERARIGDSYRLKQILHNLLSNAVKFTDEGEVAVRMTGDDETVEIAVADTGVGMSEEQRSRVFAKFVQADASTTRRFGGTGLGLSIVRALIEAQGGSIVVTGEPGAGSRFVVRLPAPLARGAPERRAAAPDAPEVRAPSRRLAILAADDNLVNRRVVAALLAGVDAELVFAETGREALDLWAERSFDLVLMDIQMPDMDGVAATREIRRIEAAEGRPHTPVWALTANVFDQHRKAYAEAGMDGCVAKPIQKAALLAAVAEAAACGGVEARLTA